MTTVAYTIFMTSFLLLVYTYIGFPMWLLARAAVFKRPVRKESIFPDVSIVIAAYNEEDCLRAKLDRLLQTDYPLDRLQVIVVSDGSTDGTDQIVRSYDSELVELIRVDRMGKAGALNAAIPYARGSILVFTDANSMFATDALRQLVASFADESVGAVAGDQRYLPSAAIGVSEPSSGSGEKTYWRFDRWLKQMESRAGNTISATGAIYAIRKSLFDDVPEGVTDDFAISTAVIEKGYRLVFCGAAVAYEPVAGSHQVEFGRKVRVISRGFRSVWLRRRLLNPFRSGFYAVQLISHKVLRRLMAFPLMALLASTFMLWSEHVLFAALALAQTAFYLVALWPLAWRAPIRSKILQLPFFFCLVNFAAALALVRTLIGIRVTRWEPQREASACSAGLTQTKM